MRISDWSSDVFSSDLPDLRLLTLNHASPADHLDPRAQIRLGPEVAGRQVEPVAAVSDTGFDVVGDHRLEVHQLIHGLTGGSYGAKIGRASCRERVCQEV